MAEKEIVRTDAAPAPFQGAPYSQAVVYGDLVFVAGQVGGRPGQEGLAEPVEEQTEQACANIQAILAAAGSGFGNVLNTTVYLTDFADFNVVNEVYRRYAGDSPPARATVQVSALPGGAKVEIAVVAHV